jgi:hypothetical protein
MKTHRPTRCPRGYFFNDLPERGFALVVTLSLMVLLTIVAVGLLTLAGVSLRTSSQSEAMATARANARLALLLALGDLQKLTGPDQRITARADVDSGNTANPRLTGVWESWNIDPNNPPSPSEYEPSARDGKFLGWLASSADGKSSETIGFAKSAPTNSVTLWGGGTLGDSAAAEDLVSATRLPTSPSRGAVAWAVMDEGVKVRINTPYVEDAPTKGRQTTQLGSGVRPDASTIPTLSALESGYFERDSPEFASIEKGISRLNLELAAETLAAGTGELLKPLTHDVSSTSAGLFTDVAKGGLKEDFNLLANETNLPPEYRQQGVYASLLGMDSSAAPSDPNWESLHGFSRLYRDSSRLVASGGVPVLRATAPGGWAAASATGAVNLAPPEGLVLLPSIAKVQVVFSLVGRDLYPNLPANISGPLTPAQKANRMHQPQDEHFRNTRFDYDLHLLYTPVVTLHNPYNVAIEFTQLRVEFIHVPFAMKVFRNGVAQSTDFAPLETMYGDNRDGSRDKIFGMNLKTKSGSGTPGSTRVRLMPGEVKMFSPYIDPKRSYQTDLGNRTFWDIYVGTGITTNIDAIPGWRGDGIGFDCDNLSGAYAVDGVAANGRWTACLGLAWDDRIHVEFVPRNIPRAKNKFAVKMTARLPGSSVPVVVSAIEMDYETRDGLQDFIKDNGAEFPMRYPKKDAVPNYVLGSELVERARTPIGSLTKTKPFALLSLQGKTTSGGRDVSNEDGRLATKPWSFAHSVVGATSQKVVSEHSANFSHEIDLQPLDGSTANLLSVDPQDRSSFITGHTSFNGAKFGAMYDVPLAPLQTLVSLNGANPGGSSGYLPRFAQPIGNSWAHPLLDPARISSSGAAGPLLDHSFLLNLALYDRFYFSGLADRTGSFDPGQDASGLAEEFAGGEPLVDPRLRFHAPDGGAAAGFSAEVSASGAHRTIAAWQMMDGAFNINSTSVAAWKAMLGSIHDSKALINQLNKAADRSSFNDLPATGNGETRISRFRMPASPSEADGGEPADAYWLGPREYSDADLERLAEQIVRQVRERGPFLSMAEFVNRRLGSATDEKAQRGALQQAIDNTNLNAGIANNANAGFNIDEAAVAAYKYANPKAGAGPSYQGAPGYLSQADLLAVLGNAATPRSDTFTVRGYGEARDASDRTTATAVCEAVVQRVPDFVDAADSAATAPANLTSEANKTFGRRYQIVSFRWLATGEI